jgi:hypothetical protein
LGIGLVSAGDAGATLETTMTIESVAARFSPHDKVIHTNRWGDEAVVNFRGYHGHEMAVVVMNGIQMSVPVSELSPTK